jgi:hypothetical protein
MSQRLFSLLESCGSSAGTRGTARPAAHVIARSRTEVEAYDLFTIPVSSATSG